MNYFCAEQLLKLKFEKIVLFLKERGQNVTIDVNFFALADSFPVTHVLKHIVTKEQQQQQQIEAANGVTHIDRPLTPDVAPTNGKSAEAQQHSAASSSTDNTPAVSPMR